MKLALKIIGISILITFGVLNAGLSQIYSPDNGDGTYKNPIIHADYSDPDVVRVEDDFYMVSSSFNCVPGLPVLHSKDLVNWQIVNHILPNLIPSENFDEPQHGNGVWAPSIRYHEGWFYVYYGDPDYGIYMIKTQNPSEKWNNPVLVKSAKGWIDPCPLWDEDGKAYLVHAFAGSRAANKSVLIMHEMSPDGEKILDDGVLVFDGHKNHPTIEGPKLYKRNGYYYIFAPAGGVTYGWQSVLRSKNIFGPYEYKDVLHQGGTNVNGPHQGALVELNSGESWFIHFQDKAPYGRIVHLQPAKWKDDWITIGVDNDKDGKGEPVYTFKKPDVGKSHPVMIPQTSDEFNSTQLGLQWQWHGNPKPLWSFTSNMGFLRLNPVILNDEQINLWDLPNLLMQKMPAETFSATVKFDFFHQNETEEFGMVVMGRDYAYVSILREDGKAYLKIAECIDAEQNSPENYILKKEITNTIKYFKTNVTTGGKVTFAFSEDGNIYESPEYTFQSREGKWIGAKIGLFSIRDEHINDGGYTNVDWFRISD